MSVHIGSGKRILVLVALSCPWVTVDAMAQSIQGTATYRERLALPARAIFEATIEDVSRADARAEVIASTRIASPGNPPIAFTIAYDPARILSSHHYVLRARILLDSELLFTTDTAPPVITRGSATRVSLTLRSVRAGAPPAAAGQRTLEGTYWRAVELAGSVTPTQDPRSEAHVVFQGGRVSGSDGCNRITGGYQLKGELVTFGRIAGTQMACANSAPIERAFHDALTTATRLTVVATRLELFDSTGTRVAAFMAGAEVSPPVASAVLAGTAWQLVEFQGSDGTTLTPDDATKYTIEFGAGGQLAARIDCNRGRGTWKSNGPNQLQLGPLAMTRASCPVGSLHDHMVKQWGFIRSYLLKEGHLFLSLMADGGIYEFAPLAP